VLFRSPTAPGGSPEPVVATFAFAMSSADVAVRQHAPEPEGLASAAPSAPETAPARPHLFVSDKVVMYGPARVSGAEFYRIAGHADLAVAYEKNARSIRTVRGLGFTALGIGGTTLVLALVAATAVSEGCAASNTIATFDGGKPQSCSVGALFVIPLAFTATGGVLLGVSAGMTRDPLTLQERRALANDFNARVDSAGGARGAAARPARPLQLGVSGGPLPSGNGGVMLLTGRF